MKRIKCIDITYIVFALLLTTIACSLVASLVNFYSSCEISEIYNQIISQNLKNSPIFDIKINKNCSDSDKNILGTFGGTKKGYEYSGKEYIGNKEDSRECKSKRCTDINPIPETEYQKLKNNIICGSRTTKNYFDYYKLSVKQGKECEKNQKSCGYLDYYNNILCLPENMECPINDIFISNQSNLFYPNYKSIKLSDNEYLYYSTENPKGYIITSLSPLLFGEPCGSRTYNFFIISSLDIFPYCNYNNRNYNYYYSNKLISLNAKEFFSQNNLYDKITNIPSYYNFINNETLLDLFAIGYIGISDKFIESYNPDVNFMSNVSRNLKTRRVVSLICFISIIVLGGYTMFVLPISIFTNKFVKLLLVGIELIILLLIEICALIEMGNSINYFPEGQFPKDYYKLNSNFDRLTDLMGNEKAHYHFWPFFPLLLFTIAYYFYIFKHKEEEKENEKPIKIDPYLLAYCNNYNNSTANNNYISDNSNQAFLSGIETNRINL